MDPWCGPAGTTSLIRRRDPGPVMGGFGEDEQPQHQEAPGSGKPGGAEVDGLLGKIPGDGRTVCRTAIAAQVTA